MQIEHALTMELAEEFARDLKIHAPVLVKFAERLTPEREQLVSAWSTGNMQSHEWCEQSASVLFDTLKSKPLDIYLQGVAEWGRNAVGEKVNYVQAIQQFACLRRAALPLMMKVYSPGADLQMTFSALDALERAVSAVIAAAYIEAVQAQLGRTARLRTVGLLTHGIAHSLNNLLANILGRAQFLAKSVSDDEMRGELREIENAARNAGENLRRVQAYAAERADEEFIALDMNAIIHEAVQLTRYRWRDEAEANGIVIDVIKDLSDVPQVRGKRGALRDTLVELLLNAVDALPQGGLVTVRTERVHERARVTVTDLGIGMDEFTRTRSPEPFFTTKDAGHVGWGLAMVAACVAEHKGQLEIESTPEHGTSVMLLLPLANVETLPKSAIADLPDHSLNILVVDDDASLREIIGRSLALRGHRVLTAESGGDAIQIFQEQSPIEVVLSDLGMPGMNGFEIARVLKKLAPQMIVILMTGWAAELDLKKVRESGIDRTLSKPFDVEQVLHLISEVIRERAKA